MLSREENELLCRIGAGTPMGTYMRRYWMPAMLSSELQAGGDPKRVRLLGEDLVAFRDAKGSVGLVDENCPHRGASLALARVEECGLRCLYHGWVIAPDGRVLETPPEPDELGFRDKVRALAYPVHESGGMIWAYLGPAGTEPPLPNFPFCNLPPEHVHIMKVKIDCNWAQAIEGVIDSAHTNYLHKDTVLPVKNDQDASVYRGANIIRPSNDGQPKIECRNTNYGFRYAAIRKPTVDADKNKYIRVTLFIAPFYASFPAGKGWANVQGMLPVDDEHTMFHFWRYCFDRPMTQQERDDIEELSGFRMGKDIVDPHTFQLRVSRSNDWLQDRAAMTGGTSHTGIAGANLQDIAVEESMGAIYDRSKEHLGTSDVAVIRMRRLMIDGARALAEKGTTPMGLGSDVHLEDLLAEEKMIPLDDSWAPISAQGDLSPA
jgi:phthalate 4,5-dioxygenase oxygenase subunit